MKKEKGTFDWVFTFAGQKKSGYIASVIFAVIGAVFQILPFLWWHRSFKSYFPVTRTLRAI